MKGKPKVNPRKSPPPFTLEHRNKISLGNKGKKLSLEHRKKLSEFRKLNNPQGFKKGNQITKGVRLSLRHRLKLSNALRGEKSYMWRGGLTKLAENIRKSFIYRQWRSDIFTKDKFTCRICGQVGGVLNADHFPKAFSIILRENKIKTLEQAFACEELWNLNNGRVLCLKCHKKTPNYLKKRIIENQ